MELILCRVAASSCLPTHNIALHISLHDPPYHMTMKKYEDFEGMVIFPIPPQKFAIRNMVLELSTVFAYFALSLSASKYT